MPTVAKLDLLSNVMCAVLQVWHLRVDCHVLDHCGNLVDACCLSALAALMAYRKPEVSVGRGGDSENIFIHSPEVHIHIPLTGMHTQSTKQSRHGAQYVVVSGCIHLPCWLWFSSFMCTCDLMQHCTCTCVHCISGVLQVKEPQPLSLHHLPFAVTFALFEVRGVWHESTHPVATADQSPVRVATCSTLSCWRYMMCPTAANFCACQ